MGCTSRAIEAAVSAAASPRAPSGARSQSPDLGRVLDDRTAPLPTPCHESLESGLDAAAGGELLAQDDPVLDGHAGAAGKVRGHGVRSVADEYDASAIPRTGTRTVSSGDGC